MEATLWVATDQGVFSYQRESRGWSEMITGLEGIHITSLVSSSDFILAGSRHGVCRSADGGRSWQEANAGLEIKYVRWLATAQEKTSLIFAGTEPAGVFISLNDGLSWQACPEVIQMRNMHGWYLPYSPEAGCVRGFAIHGKRIYAAVEVGGVLRSDDGGESWQLVSGASGNPADDYRTPSSSVNPDVHDLAIHPSSLELVYAPTGGGFYRSRDGGKSWELNYRCYCRAVWVNPVNPEHLILGPADGVDRGGRIEMTLDGGKTWMPASVGLDVPWSHHMVERFYQVGEELLAVLSNGELYSTMISNLYWRRILPDLNSVNAIASLELG